MLEKVIEILSEFTEVKAEDMNKDTIAIHRNITTLDRDVKI